MELKREHLFKCRSPACRLRIIRGGKAGAKTVSAGTWLMSSCLALALEGFDDVEQEKRRGTIHRAQEELALPIFVLAIIATLRRYNLSHREIVHHLDELKKGLLKFQLDRFERVKLPFPDVSELRWNN